MSDEDEDEDYIALINEEEQYSIWFSWKDIPPGWRRVGPQGKKQQVLDYIKEVWTDMRPKSLRKELGED